MLVVADEVTVVDSVDVSVEVSVVVPDVVDADFGRRWARQKESPDMSPIRHQPGPGQVAIPAH